MVLDLEKEGPSSIEEYYQEYSFDFQAIWLLYYVDAYRIPMCLK